MIKSPYLIIDNIYQIKHPVYNDFNENIQPEIEIVQVIKKLQYGYLLKNIKLDFLYEIKYYILETCEIEEYENKS